MEQEPTNDKTEKVVSAPQNEAVVSEREQKLEKAKLELLSTPDGKSTYDFIINSLTLNLPEQFRRKTPEMLEQLVANGNLSNDSRDFLLSILQGETSDRLKAMSDYWNSSEVAESYSEGALGDDNSLEVFSQKADFLSSQLNNNDTVLDLGSGTGLSAKIIFEATQRGQKTIRFFGTDISRSMFENNALKDKYEKFVVADLQQGIPQEYRDLKQKVIMSIGVTTYLNPDGMKKVIADMSSIISADGLLCFTVSLDDSEKLKDDLVVPIYDFNEANESSQIGVGDPISFYHYYQREWINKLLEENNLEVVDETEYCISKIESKYPSILFVCKKKSEDVS